MKSFIYKTRVDLTDGKTFEVRTKNPLGIDALDLQIVAGALETTIVEDEVSAASYPASTNVTVIKGYIVLLSSAGAFGVKSREIPDPTIPYKATVAPVPIYGGGVVGNAEVPLTYYKNITLNDNHGTASWTVVLTSYDLPLPSDI